MIRRYFGSIQFYATFYINMHVYNTDTQNNIGWYFLGISLVCLYFL